jgi:hypothetical protein
MSLPGMAKKALPPSPPIETNYDEIKEEGFGDEISAGFTIGHAGRFASGKTSSALALGFMQKQYLPQLRKAKLDVIADLLENGKIPEIKRIIIIESENSAQKQFSHGSDFERFKELRSIIKFIHIDPVSKEECATADGTEIKKKSLDEIQGMCDKYMNAIEKYAKIDDPNTLLILDSGSRLKLLLDTKAEIIVQKQIKQASTGPNGTYLPVSEETEKRIKGAKWINRNQWWNRYMTLIRGIKGWVVVTFMDEEVSQWIQDMQSSKGKVAKQETREWSPKTEFNFDLITLFKRNTINQIITAEVESSRYIKRGESPKPIEIKGRYAYLKLINEFLTYASKIEPEEDITG